MNKKIKKLLIFFIFSLLVNNAQASLLWDINYGIDLYKRNNLQAAKNYFLSYTSNNPNDKDAYFWLAKIYQKTKNEKNKAQECFKKAYELTLSEKNIEKLDFNINNNDNIEDYFDMAAMYFESGDFEEAELYADMMLKINPKSSSAYFIKAKVAHIMNKEQKAKEYLNLALIYNNDLLKTNLAKSLNISDIPDMSKEMYATFAYEAYFSGDIDKAIKYLKKCIALDSSNIDISIMLIDSFIKKNEIFEAQKMIDDILQNNPNDIQALYYQAKIYKLSNNEENYEQTCLKAYEINPNNQQILLELGNFYLAKEDYTNSKKYFEILVNVNDMFYEGYYGYIYSLIELGQLKEILPLVRKMTLINQNASINSFLLAKICEKQGDYEQAQEYLKEALIKDENPVYYYELGKVNTILKKYSQAIINFKDAKELSNDRALKSKIDIDLLNAYLKNDDYSAVKVLIHKTELDKDSIMYKYYLYNLNKNQIYDKDAQVYLSQIKKYKPNKIEEYLDLSQVYYEINGFDSALKILDKGIKKYPQEPMLYTQKIKFYYLENNQEKIQETLSIMEEIFK